MCSMVLTESIAYYWAKKSFLLNTFLDATEAYDRVKYFKLFNWLMQRKLPALAIRVLIFILKTSCAFLGSALRLIIL
jgi:hypothetical protein